MFDNLNRKIDELREKHYNRNELQKDSMPETPREAAEVQDYEREMDERLDKYHEQGEQQKNLPEAHRNNKYLRQLGDSRASMEHVYDRDKRG